LADDNRQFVARDAARVAAPPVEPSTDSLRVAAELAAFLEVADQGYAICICNSPAVRRRILASISSRLTAKGVAVFELDLAAGARSITALIRQALATPEFAALQQANARVAVSVNNIADTVTKEEWEADARPVPLQGLNQQRDWVRKLGRPVLIWVGDWLAGKLPSLAPDFWVGRSVVFEFRTEPEFRDMVRAELGPSRGSFTSPEDARRKVRIYRDLVRQEKQPEQKVIHMARLGGLLSDMARYSEAEKVLRRALSIAEETLGPDHPNVATALNNLAALLRKTHWLYEAELMFRKAIAIGQKALGEEHPDVATGLNNLALLLRDMGRLAEAEPMYRKALGIRQKALPPEHPDIARSLNNLASLLQDVGKLAEAEPMLRKALAIRQKALGEDHPDAAFTLNNLAGLLYAMHRNSEAEPLARRSLEILLKHTKATGHEHPNLRGAFGNYAGLLRAMGRSEKEIGETISNLAAQYGVKLGER